MKLFKDSFWANIGALLSQVIALVTTIIVARFIGPHEYGLLATALVLLLFVQRFLLESFGYSVVRDGSEVSGFLESAHFCSVIFGFIAFFIFLILSLILYCNDSNELSLVVLGLSIITILEGFSTVRTAILKRDAKFKELTGRVLFSNVLSGVIAVFLAYCGMGVWSLIVQQISLSFFNLIFSYRYSGWKYINKKNKDQIMEIMKFSLPMMGNSILFISANRIDILFLSVFSSPSSVGLYSMAKRLVRIIPDVFLSGSNTVLMTYLRNLDRKEAIELTLVKLKYVSSLTFPLVILLSLYSERLIFLFFGSKWSGVSDIIEILCGLILIQIISSILSTLIISSGHSKVMFKVNFVQFFILCFSLVFILFFNDLNANNIAFSFVFSASVSLILILYYILKIYKLKLIRIVHSIVVCLLSTVLMFLFSVFFKDLLLFNFDFFNIIFSGLILLIFYLLFLIVFDRDLRNKFLIFFKKV